jgi:integrase
MNIAQRIDEVLRHKARKVRFTTLALLRQTMYEFVAFFENRGVTDSAVLTNSHVLALLGSWKYADSTEVIRTRQIRFFLRKLDRDDLAKEVEMPKWTAEGKQRRRPRPYTDDEIERFRAVADPKSELFFVTSIMTGLAVADLVRLSTEHLRDGCVRIRRQKTGKECIIPISPELFNQLKVALPFYTPTRASDKRAWIAGAQLWSERIRVMQQKASIWQKGSLVHHGRDSFVERQLVAGVPLSVIAARLGDLPVTVQTHYADLLSNKMIDLNLGQPVVTL